MDLIIYFAAALALQLAGYAIYRSYIAAMNRSQLSNDMRMTRPRSAGIAAIGGNNRPGQN